MKQALHNQVEQLRLGVEPPPPCAHTSGHQAPRQESPISKRSSHIPFFQVLLVHGACDPHRRPRQDPSNARLRRARHKSRTAFASSVFNSSVTVRNGCGCSVRFDYRQSCLPLGPLKPTAVTRASLWTLAFSGVGTCRRSAR